MSTKKNIHEFLGQLRDEGLRWRTVKLYGDILLRFRNWSDTDINMLTEADIKDYLRGIRGTGAHLKEVIGVIRRYFNWLGLPVNPAAGLRRKQPHRREILPITTEEFRRIHAAAGLEIKNLLTFLSLTGLRISEVLNARRTDFLLDRIEQEVRRPLMMVKGKGGKVRYIPLVNSGLVCWLETRLSFVRPREVCIEGCVVTVDGPFASMTYTQAWYGINMAAIRAGVQRELWRDRGVVRYYVSPHSIRRYCATSMLERGVPLDVVQEILGHADVNTTRRYAKTSEGRIWEAMGLMGGTNLVGGME